MAKGPTIEVKITGDTKGLSKATGRAEKDLEGFGKKVSGFAVGAGAAITTFGINAIPALVGFGAELYSLGQASEVGAKKTAKVFGDSAADISEWADEVNESLGLSDEAVGTLATSRFEDWRFKATKGRPSASGSTTRSMAFKSSSHPF